MTENKFYLEIESDPQNLITVEEFVNYFAKEIGLEEEKISGLLIAVTEATTNAIIHANKSDKSKVVFIAAEVIENKLIIKIRDEGTGFDPTIIPDPTQPENLLKDSGRGLYLMKVYMDDVQYKFTETGMETTLTLNLNYKK